MVGVMIESLVNGEAISQAFLEMGVSAKLTGVARVLYLPGTYNDRLPGISDEYEREDPPGEYKYVDK